jgi:hypothetical protein
MQPITTSYKTLHIVHNTSHAYKVKQDSKLHSNRYYMHRGLPCSKKMLESMALGALDQYSNIYGFLKFKLNLNNSRNRKELK